MAAVVAGDAAAVIKRFGSQWKSDSSPGKAARIPDRGQFPVNVCGVIRQGLGRAKENRMAKGSDNLADSFDSENTGGLLSGLLAEEETLDRRALWRLGSWGVGAVGAVIVGLLANQSSIESRRQQPAAADLARQSQLIQAVAKESQNETRRLTSAIDTLNGDRDRLYSRVTVLEQGLDTVTGTIARQKSTAASTSAAPAGAATPGATATPVAAATPPMSAAAAVQAATQSPNPPPLIGPVATIAASSADKPHMEAANTPAMSPSTVASVAPETANTPAAATTPAAAAPPAAAAAAPTVTPATPSTPLMESKSMMAPPDAAAGKLIEPEAAKNADAATPAPSPEVVASTPPATGAEPDSTQAISQPAVQRTEFAVDIGGANSIGGLRALWQGLLKSRSNAPLAALQPIIVVKESNTGLGMQLRLVAGPLGDAAAAAKICATMIENKRTCETTVFDGQHLAVKAGDEPSASAAPASASAKSAPVKPAAVKPVWHRHSYAKRVMTEDPAKKPDPPSTLSTLSSYFGNH
jgi:hypothetical protein